MSEYFYIVENTKCNARQAVEHFSSEVFEGRKVEWLGVETFRLADGCYSYRIEILPDRGWGIVRLGAQ